MDMIETLGKAGIIPVIVIEKEEQAVPLAKALVKGGLPVLEVTFRTKAAAGAIAAIKRRLGLRTDLREFNLSDEDKHALAAASRHPNLFNNPVDISEDMLYQMYVSLT